jgi:DNA-binding IclR family transcriptional regulator
MNPAGKPVVKSADRVLDLFELLAHKGRALTHSELCAELGIPKSSLSQLVGNLVERGYLQFTPGAATYGIGQRLMDLVERQRHNITLPELAQPLCDRLTRLTGESSSLNLRRDDMMQRVCGANSTQPLTFSMSVGQVAPLYAVSSGKVMLAWLPEQELAAYLAANPLSPITPRTLTSASALRKQLKEVRRDGVAWSVEEYTPGIVGIGVPVFQGDDEQPIAAFNIAMPSVRDSAAQRARIVGALKEAAASLQKDLLAAQEARKR